jgi:hypothetical protein
MLTTMIAIFQGWKKVFAQNRTTSRAINQALSSVCVIGRRTIARSYLVRGGEGDWSSEYKLHSRSPWEAQKLFEPILQEAIEMCPGQLIPMGSDETRTRKSGKKIKTAHWGRDPLSPPFHVNLSYGLRWLHTSILLPLHQRQAVSARALPVWFEEVAPVRKPGKKATEAEKKAYRAAVKKHNLSRAAVGMFKQMRKQVDQLGGENKTLAYGLDGSFCNRTLFKADLERTILIARARKDAKLSFPAPEGRRIYSEQTFTPEEVRKDERIPWQERLIFHGGKWRTVYYKEVNEVLWQRGGGPKRLRLLVVKPVPYRKTKKGRLLYRQPAFLLTTDTKTDTRALLQIYFDRWQVEVAHRELKDNFGLGQAQVRVPASVARQPVLSVATYSAMHLAALKAFGPQRPDEFGPLPKYQRDKTRASCQELIRNLRNEVVDKADLLPFDLNITRESMLAAATI